MGQQKTEVTTNPESPQQLLETCRMLKAKMADLGREIEELSRKHAQAKDVTDATNPALQGIDTLTNKIMSNFRELAPQMQRLKGKINAGNDMVSGQIGLLTTTMNSLKQNFDRADMQYRKDLREQLKRQYRIVRPEATEAEAEEAASEQNAQIFSQAVSLNIICNEQELTRNTAHAV